MCGRYTLTFTIEEANKAFDVDRILEKFNPNYNVAPMQKVPVVYAEDNKNILDTFRWGLIPHWAKDPKIAYKMINARGETVGEKPAYKHAFTKSRCLVLADGFFEWMKTKEGKKPYYIQLKDRKLFAFAGISSKWKSPKGEEIKSCSIITTSPNKFVKKIHDRMPVILPKKDESKWLDKEITDVKKLNKMLKAYPTDKMKGYEVSTIVNSPKNNSAECLEEI